MRHSIVRLTQKFKRDAHRVSTQTWQGLEVSHKPDMDTMEILHQTLSSRILSESLGFIQRQVEPNLPWADDHFEERVCGEPLNPGAEWKNWPWGHSADRFRDSRGQFNHNYMERYWPKYAGMTPDGELTKRLTPEFCKQGIRGEYGDLSDLVKELAHDPYTRQSYLPIWFPEDTGSSGRKPCTLGYHLIQRSGKLDITYYIRSCDIIRHMKDDIYLTIRLLLWVLKECRKLNPDYWEGISPGTLTMHITSLHCFINDFQGL